MQPNAQQIQVNAGESELKGRFSNVAQVSHQPDHFVVDFFMVTPPAGQLVSRIALTPSHAKKLAEALQVQLKQFETSYGKIKEVADKGEHSIGFKAT